MVFNVSSLYKQCTQIQQQNVPYSQSLIRIVADKHDLLHEYRLGWEISAPTSCSSRETQYGQALKISVQKHARRNISKLSNNKHGID
jgi:hypothetical protein